jgi:Protein of unknown function (DUF3891)
MVLREDADGVLAIGQPSHAWISGQLARAWGNARFGEVDPCEEVCLAAEQHDIGMTAWDLEPTLNAQTGLPHSFMEMPIDVHIGLWRAGPGLLVAQSRYAALLVSMHGMRLYEKRDLSRLTEEQAAEVAGFLRTSRSFQEDLLASLAADRDQVRRNSDLLWTWDFMSLALCLDWAPCTAQNVPTADGYVDLRLEPDGTVHPWPFASEHVTVRAEGRRLPAHYDSDQKLAAALASARWETVAFELRSA